MSQPAIWCPPLPGSSPGSETPMPSCCGRPHEYVACWDTLPGVLVKMRKQRGALFHDAQQSCGPTPGLSWARLESPWGWKARLTPAPWALLASERKMQTWWRCFFPFSLSGVLKMDSALQPCRMVPQECQRDRLAPWSQDSPGKLPPHSERPSAHHHPSCTASPRHIIPTAPGGDACVPHRQLLQLE